MPDSGVEPLRCQYSADDLLRCLLVGLTRLVEAVAAIQLAGPEHQSAVRVGKNVLGGIASEHRR